MPPRRATIGRSEYIALPKLGVLRVAAKVDTGAYSSALHVQQLSVRDSGKGNELVVKFRLGGKRTTMVFKRFRRVVVKTSTGHRTERYLINTTVLLGRYQQATEFTLVDRSDMKHSILLGRKFLSNRFVVDVALKNAQGV
jgi:hypothetical protein